MNNKSGNTIGETIQRNVDTLAEDLRINSNSLATKLVLIVHTAQRLSYLDRKGRRIAEQRAFAALSHVDQDAILREAFSTEL